MATIEKAVKVPGWMNVTELEWLAQQATTHKRIVEVGSYVGRSTTALADNTDGVILAVDDWTGPRDAVMAWKDRQVIYEKFTENLKGHIESGRVIPWRTTYDKVTPDEVAQRVPSLKFDMVFLDGDHQYASVLRDIHFWIQFTEPGSLLCGHDYELSYPGVIQALSETVGDPGVVPYCSIWWHEVTSEDLAKLVPAAEMVGAA